MCQPHRIVITIQSFIAKYYRALTLGSEGFKHLGGLGNTFLYNTQKETNQGRVDVTLIPVHFVMYPCNIFEGK